MPIFISYSRADSDFATKLAMQLVKHKATVWVDQWELHVGDSLITRIQDAIQGASGLLVILSKASVQSEWCKKELSSGLIRELEEKRVVVLPVLIEDCAIPLFLREKLYADFRTDFDAGLRSILEAIARVTSDSLLRLDTPEWHVDWSIEWGFDTRNDTLIMELTSVEQAIGQPYSVLTQVHIDANATATARYRALERADLGWVERAAIIDILISTAAENDVRLQIEDEKKQTATITVNDTKSPSQWRVHISSRRLGADTGRDVLIDVAKQLASLRAGQKDMHRKLTSEERLRLLKIQSQFESGGPDPRDYLAF